MSRTIDERIVDMQFNNKQFETGIQDSLRSIDNLKKGLGDMDGAGKALDSVGESANKLGFNFSALEIMVATVLAKLTSAVIDFGLAAAQSLFLEPMMKGFSQYEEKIGSMKAIMNATQMSAKEVGEALAGVIFYADETSFSFDQMSTAIRLFTSSGIEIEDAVKQIQGLGSASALAGVPMEKMGSVFDAVSKAIGQGSMKIREWDTLQLAGLTTSMEFKQILLDTAVEMGTLTKQGEGYVAHYIEPMSGKVKELEVSITDMRTALKSGWLDKAVLQEALNQFGDYANDVYLLTEKFTENSEELLAKYGKTMEDVFKEVGASAEESTEITRLMTEENYSFEKALLEVKQTSLIAAQAMNILSDGTDHFGERGMRAAQEARTLTETLEAVGNAIASRWRDTWELLIGDVDEATELFGGLVEALWELFVASGDTRNAILQLWRGVDEGDLDGRTILLEGLTNIGKAFLQVIEAISGAWGDIFPPITAQQLLDLTERFRDFTERLIMSDETADKVKRTLTGLFAALDLVGMAIKAVFQVAGMLIGALLPVGDGVLGVTAGLGDFIVALRNAAIDGDIFGKGVEIIGTVLDKVRSVISVAADGVKAGITRLRDYFGQFGGIDLGPLKIFSSDVEVAFTPFTFIANVFKKAFEVIVAVFQWAAPIVGPIAQKIGQAFTSFGKAIGDAIKSGDFKSLIDLVNTGLLGGVLLGLKKFIDSLSDVTSGASGILSGITGILDGVRGSLEAYQSKLKAQTLLTIAAAIGILAAALLVLSTIDAGDMAAALAAITVLFVELAATMLVLSKYMGSIKMGGIALQMVAISAAILILSSAMKNVADLSWEEVLKGAAGIAALSAILVKSANALSKSSGKLISGGLGLIAFAAAILVLTSAVEKLGQLDIATLTKGLIAVGILMAEIAVFSQIVKPDKLMSTGIAMIAVGAALAIMANAIKTLGELSIEELIKGLTGIGVILASFAGFTQIVKPEKLVSTGIAMIAIGTALNIMANAVSTFGGMSLEELAKGLIAMGVALASIAGFTQIISTEKILTTSIAMIGFGAALLIIAQAVKSFGSMSWEEIAKGLVALAGSLIIMAVAMNAMTGGLAGAAAMLVMSAAILVLAPALMMLGSMNLAEIGLALLALVGVFAVVGVAGLVLAPLTPVILGLAAAIALLGVGVFAIGAGLLAFSAGLTALAVAGTAGAAALVIAVTSIISLIPMAVGALGEGLLMFIQVIADGTPIIMQALTQIIMGMIQVLVSLAPQLVDAIFVFLNKMLDTALSNVPKMVDAGLKLLTGILDGIRKNIGDIVATTLLIIAEFLKGLAAGIPSVVSAGVDIIVAFIGAISKERVRLIDEGFKMIIDFVNGLADAIRNNTPTLVTAFANLASAMIEGLVGGLFAGIKGAVDAVKNLGGAIIDGFKGVLGIASPSKVFEEFGENTPEGYIVGINNKTPAMVAAVTTMALIAVKATEEAFGINGKKSTVFEEFGVTNAESFISGLTGMGNAIKESFKTAFAGEENEEVLKSMTGLIDEALKTIEQRLESYTDLATDRFNKISTESEVSVKEMIENLKHNQKAIAEWAENIALLASRGLNEGLLEELRQAGPKSAGEVKALVAASDKEIQELNTVMAKGGEVATQALAVSVGSGAPLLVEEGKSLVDSIAEGLTSTSSVNDAMAMMIDHAKRVGLQEFNSPVFQEMGKEVPEKVAKGISSGSGSVKSAITQVGKDAEPAAKDAGTGIAKEMESGLQSNSDAFKQTGDKYGTDFANAVSNTQTAAKTAGTTVTNAAEQGLKSNQAVYGQTGTKYGQDFSNALSNTQTMARTAGTTVTNAAEQGLKSNQAVYGQTGTKYGQDFANALSNTQTKAKEAGIAVAKAAEAGIKSLLEPVNEFEKLGVAVAEGFIKGMESMLAEVIKAAKKLARSAKDAIEDELDINSPSRVLYADGVYGGLGFVNGLASMIDDAANIGRKIGSVAIDSIKDAISKIDDVINSDIDLVPTITPVLDLTNIQNGSASISRMLSGVQVATPTINNVRQIASQMARNEVTNTPGAKQTTGETKFEFNQYNNSPKPLNRLEIYRQTKNQFAQLKGLVEGV